MTTYMNLVGVARAMRSSTCGEDDKFLFMASLLIERVNELANAGDVDPYLLDCAVATARAWLTRDTEAAAQ